MLVKMTDYLLCCTDGEPQSSFEIDLHMQRLVKLTGYILQLITLRGIMVIRSTGN